MNRIPHSSPRVKWRKDGPPVLKAGRLTRARTGHLYERSVLLPKPLALRFAIALRSRPDISQAMPRRDHRAMPADSPRWYVRWLRVPGPITFERSLRDMQDMRTQRAAMQADEMEFLPSDREAHWWCLHTYPDESGETGVYLVSLDSCTCPDFEYRCTGRQLLCKHPLALAISQGMAEEVQCALLRLMTPPGESHITAPTVEPADVRRARLAQERAWDFA